jgi:GT2 family glycosyltransferase
MSRTAIVVVTFNHRELVADCVHALEAALAGAGDTAHLILVDNASNDGTPDVIRGLLRPDGRATIGGLPATFVANAENVGFAAANNQALRRVRADGTEFAYLLNPDTEVEPGFLEAALDVAAADPNVSLVQSLLIRHPDRDRVNSWGNAVHFLGFGYVGGDGTPLDDPRARRETEAAHDIAYASGAAMLVRLAVIDRIGGFNEELFAYHEDLELSLRARLAGGRVVLAPASRVAHKYQFSRHARKLYWMERNRLLVLAWHYRPASWALIAPAWLTMEAGLWLYAWRTGWLGEKAKATAYVLDPRRWPAVWRARREVQSLRRVSDREATAPFVGDVQFQELAPPLLTKVANPLFNAYWRAARALMRW